MTNAIGEVTLSAWAKYPLPTNVRLAVCIWRQPHQNKSALGQPFLRHRFRHGVGEWLCHRGDPLNSMIRFPCGPVRPLVVTNSIVGLKLHSPRTPTRELDWLASPSLLIEASQPTCCVVTWVAQRGLPVDTRQLQKHQVFAETRVKIILRQGSGVSFDQLL